MQQINLERCRQGYLAFSKNPKRKLPTVLIDNNQNVQNLSRRDETTLLNSSWKDVYEKFAA